MIDEQAPQDERLAEFMVECARYFGKRKTGGEDRAHWANVFNSETCIKVANTLRNLSADNARLHQWVNDLQSGMYINCVYCGHHYGPKEDTPVAMADVLKEHIQQCPKHPLSEALDACERAFKLLEPFDDPGLSLGLGQDALTPIKAVLRKAGRLPS